jgi:Uma2 family endonuclease
MVAIAPHLNTQPIGEKRVSLHGLNWQAYQQILHALPQSRGARLTYDRGTLEITMPLEDHEFALRLIERFVAGRNVDFATDPPPDLVVEVDITRTDIDKNQLYAAMGVPEFWRCNGREWQIYQLQDGIYQASDRSPTFPWVEKEDLYQFLEQAQQDEIEAERSLRKFVQETLSCQ